MGDDVGIDQNGRKAKGRTNGPMMNLPSFITDEVALNEY